MVLETAAVAAHEDCHGVADQPPHIQVGRFHRRSAHCTISIVLSGSRYMKPYIRVKPGFSRPPAAFDRTPEDNPSDTTPGPSALSARRPPVSPRPMVSASTPAPSGPAA